MVSLRPQHNVEEENQLLSFFSFLSNIRVILQEQVVSKEHCGQKYSGQFLGDHEIQILRKHCMFEIEPISAYRMVHSDF